LKGSISRKKTAAGIIFIVQGLQLDYKGGKAKIPRASHVTIKVCVGGKAKITII